MATEGPLQAAIAAKGEGATASNITPTEFHDNLRTTNWWAATGAVAGAVLLGSAAVIWSPMIGAGSGIAATLAAGPAGYAGIVAGASLSLSTGYALTKDLVDDYIITVRPMSQEDYTYILNNFDRFSEGQILDIIASLFNVFRGQLSEKKPLKDFENSFYRSIKNRLLGRFPGEQGQKIVKNLTYILDWLFVLNGVTDVQLGAASIIKKFSKNNMTTQISIRVDDIIKNGFSLGDTSGFRNGLGFTNLAGPTIEEQKASGGVWPIPVFRYPKLNGESKIASDNLEDAAATIAANIEALGESDIPGMKKYAKIIGKDLTQNVIDAGQWWSYLSIRDLPGYNNTYKFEGKDVSPKTTGWTKEKDYKGKPEDINRAMKSFRNPFIKFESGTGNSSVVSFGDKIDASIINSGKISGVTVVPQPGANVGKVVQSLIDSGYAFYVAELGRSAFNNSSINQQTLFEECVIYYSEIIARVIGTLINNIQKWYLFLEYSALFALGEDITDEDFEGALARATEASAKAAGDIGGGGGFDADKEITEEELKNRQKFVKQCILMYNLPTLQAEYRNYIKGMPAKNPNHKIHGSIPFAGRFHAIEDTDSNNTNTINKMVVPKGQMLKPLLDITPDIHAFLVPKIRLFRVVHDPDSGGLKETEFLFRKTEDKQRIKDLLNQSDFDKGNSYGIKSFDVSFEGTNPATARNDVSANLSLYFQSFQDFLEERTAPDGTKYRIVDLLIFPVNKENRTGAGTLRAEEYDPSYYRIRAEVGWVVPESHSAFDSVLTKRGFTYKQMKDALTLTNKSFYLNMVDHDLTVKDDGTLEVKISYRAYIESALKSTKFDALSSRLLKRNREKFKKTMIALEQKDVCSAEEKNTIKELFRVAEEQTIKNVYRSIIKRMAEMKSIFYVDADITDLKEFRRNGYFSRGQAPRLAEASGGVTSQVSTVVEVKEKAKEKAEGETEESTPSSTLRLLPDGVKDYPNENIKEDNRINFFYMGDLIYTIMDNMYDDEGNYDPGMNKTKLLLSSFNSFSAFGATDSSQYKNYNIIDIPISVEYFFEWFTQNVLKPKRLFYPLMDFVRDLTNNLVVQLLFDSCANRPIDTKMRFNTANFLFLGKGNNSDFDPFLDFIPRDYPVIDLAKYYKDGDLPLLCDKEGEKDIKDFHNYIAIYPITRTNHHPGRGKKHIDEDNGIFHFELGANKGLLKKCNFSKTDIQYAREARFYRNGFDGLMQLSAVYKVSLSMIGNTIYYPGMDLFIDPVGIGGPSFSPADKNSVAYKLGLGGYHIVTRVKSSISPGKFETTVEGQWHYSGDGGDAFAHRPELDRESSGNTTEEEQNLGDVPTKKAGGETVVDTSTLCTPLVSSFEDYLIELESSSDPVEFHPDLSVFHAGYGGPSTPSNSSFIDAQGNPTDESGNPVDDLGRPVDEFGQLITSDTGEPLYGDGSFPGKTSSLASNAPEDEGDD